MSGQARMRLSDIPWCAVFRHPVESVESCVLLLSSRANGKLLWIALSPRWAGSLQHLRAQDLLSISEYL